MPDPFTYPDVHNKSVGGGNDTWYSATYPLPGHDIQSVTLTVGATPQAGRLIVMNLEFLPTLTQRWFVTINPGQTSVTTTGDTDPSPSHTQFRIRYDSNVWCPDYCTINSVVDIVFNDASPIPPPPCEHGTRITTAGVLTLALTPAIIIDVLTPWPGDTAVLAPLFSFLVGQVIDLVPICSNLPTPPPDDMSWQNLLFNYAARNQLFNHLIWWYFCECVPGTPAPVSPVQEPIEREPDWPDDTTLVCDVDDVCNALRQLAIYVQNLAERVKLLQTDVTLLQRYRLPFAYLLGVTHAGLTGGGSFAVERLLGVQIIIRERNPGRELEGAPPYIWDLGWASVMDANGFIEERRITRDVEVWQPVSMPEALTFGYFFKEGVVADVVELEAEP